MSFWQYLASSYEKNAPALKAVYPLSATSISNYTNWIAVIVVNDKGEFQNAYKIEKAKKDKQKEVLVPLSLINIPVREKSGSRTSDAKKEPHPVFEEYQYLVDEDMRFERYIEELSAFSNSEFATRQVKAIYAYIKKRTVGKDLADLRPKVKTFVVFEVQIAGDPQSKVWENPSFYDAWHAYYVTTIEKKGTDQISGRTKALASSHPKKISNASANSKLISANDSMNYTFRGRFELASQAVNVSYEDSQKAHQFLRYLINDRGFVCGEQVILSYTVNLIENSLPPPLSNTLDTLDHAEKYYLQSDPDATISLQAKTGIDYADKLCKALCGYKYGEVLNRHAQTAVMALDAPSDGRMAVTFYRELARTEYLERVAEWHEGCKWHNLYFQQKDGKKKFVSYIGAPSVDRIIEAVFGKPRGHNDQGYIKIQKSSRECLLRCIFDGAPVPKNYVESAARRASNPLAITKNDKFDRNGFTQVLSTACALIRKDFNQGNKEDYKLSIEPERTDRNYLYGRLLGAADKLEEHALYKDAKDRIVTAAIRHMQAFSQRPCSTWQTIHNCLIPYIQKVKGSFAFQEIEKIKNLFIPGDFEKDMPLTSSYLIGYYHERAYIDQLVADVVAKKKSTLNDERKEPNE